MKNQVPQETRGAWIQTSKSDDWHLFKPPKCRSLMTAGWLHVARAGITKHTQRWAIPVQAPNLVRTIICDRPKTHHSQLCRRRLTTLKRSSKTHHSHFVLSKDSPLSISLSKTHHSQLCCILLSRTITYRIKPLPGHTHYLFNLQAPCSTSVWAATTRLSSQRSNPEQARTHKGPSAHAKKATDLFKPQA